MRKKRPKQKVIRWIALQKKKHIGRVTAQSKKKKKKKKKKLDKKVAWNRQFAYYCSEQESLFKQSWSLDQDSRYAHIW